MSKFLDFIALVFYWSFLLFSWKFLFLCKIAKHKHKGILIYYIITLQYQHKEWYQHTLTCHSATSITHIFVWWTTLHTPFICTTALVNPQELAITAHLAEHICIAHDIVRLNTNHSMIIPIFYLAFDHDIKHLELSWLSATLPWDINKAASSETRTTVRSRVRRVPSWQGNHTLFVRWLFIANIHILP